jgi:LysR family transcriptional regulator, glycine cleavage system transcriptional activator
MKLMYRPHPALYPCQNGRTIDLFTCKHMNQIHSRSKRRLPPLHNLRAFEAAARNGSITRAAEELNVTQSAISHQVKALEAYLGVTLIQRRGREIALTEAGQAYYPELEAALDRIAQATERLAYQKPRASLTINVTSTFAARWLIPRLSSFCSAHPGIDVRLATTEKPLEFNPQMFDASIRCFDTPTLQALQKRRDWEDVSMAPFLEETKFPVCSPELMRDKALQSLSDLRHHTLLHANSTPHAWREWLSAAGAAGIDLEAGIRFDNLHFSLQAALRGLGVAMGSRLLVQEELDNGTLVIPFPGIESDPLRYHVICPAGAARKPDIATFCNWLLAIAQEPPAVHLQALAGSAIRKA